MNTPVCDFVKEYAKSNMLRLHMPGHKGCDRIGSEHLDITEIDGADVLYFGDGIISESENNAKMLFGTEKTLYSAEGSSLSIRAMLYLAVMYSCMTGREPKIAALRNVHKTFVTASAILDIGVDWIYPQKRDTLISCRVTKEDIEEVFRTKSPTAVYVTSPDYLGNMLDIEGIAEVCHKNGALLLVDNAHGAYLNFLAESLHPMALGADICCDSAHKTLPVLTGGGYLHISKTAPKELTDTAETAMSLFASTSPSYLILQSLDTANKYIADGYADKLCGFVKKAEELKNSLKENGYIIMGGEPLKITVETKPYGYSGDEFSKLLYDKGIVCEFSDPDYVVMMLTPEIGEESLDRIKSAMAEIERKERVLQGETKLPVPKKAMSPKEALFSPSEELETKNCEGRILASPSVSCPPAVPVAVCGEIIDRDVINTFEYYGIKKCRVVK